MVETEDLLDMLEFGDRLEAERQMVLYGNAFIELITDEDETTARIIKNENLEIVQATR